MFDKLKQEAADIALRLALSLGFVKLQPVRVRQSTKGRQDGQRRRVMR
ncbi:hypothetical protein [Epibacterium ulvae]|nr:hypothetical protein [Epibacterium ulvae]